MGLLDVFKPKWQSSDIVLRKQAVYSLGITDLDALLEVAKNDEEADIRKIAIQKISSAAHLSDLLKNEQDVSVQNTIKESLRKIRIKTVKNHEGKPTEEINKILDELQPKDKGELLALAKSPDIRLLLLKECSKQGVLAAVIKSEQQEAIALAALAKLQSESLLDEIANSKDGSKFNSVRSKAKEMLNAIQISKIDPEKEQANALAQKQQTLLAHVTRLMENKDPLSIDAEMQRLEAAAQGLQLNQELNSVFEKHKESVAAEKARISAEKQAEQEAEEQAKREKEAQRKKADEAEEARLKEAEETRPKDIEDSNTENQEEKFGESKEIQLNEEEYNAKLLQLQSIINKVNELDENGDFNEISHSIRQAFYDWKEIVGDKKNQFKNVYKEFRTATSRFQNLQEWASWHAEQIREQLIKDIEELGNAPIVIENRTKAFAMLEQWKAAGYMPAAKTQELWPRFKTGLDKIMDSIAPLLKEQEKEQEDNLKLKEDICAQIENLAITEGEWNEQLKKTQELQAKWKSVGFVPKAQNHTIWERYQSAINAFFKKQETFKKLINEKITERITAREKLCEDAEALANSTDWKNTPKVFTKLSSEWKNAGSVPAEQYEKLLQRFKKASDTFFTNRSLFFENTRKAREEICQKLEALDFNASNAQSVAEWKAIEEEWKALENNGYSKELNERFFAISDRLWETASKNNPEITKELDKNWETKHSLLEQLKEIIEQGNFKFKSIQTVRQLQTEWESTGRCGSAEVEISGKFAELVKSFFSLYNDQKDIRNNLDKINAQKKEDLCKQAEELLLKAKNQTLTRAEIISETNSLRGAWRESGNVSMHLAKTLWKRFNTACNNACNTSDSTIPEEETVIQ